MIIFIRMTFLKATIQDDDGLDDLTLPGSSGDEIWKRRMIYVIAGIIDDINLRDDEFLYRPKTEDQEEDRDKVEESSAPMESEAGYSPSQCSGWVTEVRVLKRISHGPGR